MTKRAEWLWALALLSAYALLSMGSAWQESATYDEPLHILAGTLAWKTTFSNLEPSNPPLSIYWQTLPFIGLRFKTFPPQDHLEGIKYGYSFHFVHNNRHSLTWMLQAPRAMTVILGLFLGAVLFIWAHEALGGPAALATLFAYAFCPVLLGYGSLVKADIGGALGWLLVYFFGWRWSQKQSHTRAFLVGFSMGLALCLKYSAVLAIPAVLGTFFFEMHHSSTRERLHRWPLMKAAFFMLLGMNVILALCFRGWGWPEWLRGFSSLAAQLKEGHLNYFWGHYNKNGWLLYFFTAFLLKTPLPFLFLICGCGFLLRSMDAPHRRFLAVWSLWPSALILGVSSFSKIQVGIRHILPIYPFLCLWVGMGAATLWQSRNRLNKRAVVFLGAWYAAGSLLAFPRYLSYFNETIGPSSNGYHYFVDSNLDWGQGLKALGHYLQEQGSPTIYLSYFGCSDPSAYGIRFQPVLMTTCADVGLGNRIPSTQEPLYLAVSATNRVGLYYTPHDAFAWLDRRRPVKIFMDSIWLYDITNDPEARARLQALAAAH